MVKIKFKGEITILNGFVMLQNHTRDVSEEQARTLIDKDPGQWEVVGGILTGDKPKKAAPKKAGPKKPGGKKKGNAEQPPLGGGEGEPPAE